MQERLAALTQQLQEAPEADSGAAKEAAAAAEAALAEARAAIQRKEEAEAVAAALRQEADDLARCDDTSSVEHIL